MNFQNFQIVDLDTLTSGYVTRTYTLRINHDTFTFKLKKDGTFSVVLVGTKGKERWEKLTAEGTYIIVDNTIIFTTTDGKMERDEIEEGFLITKEGDRWVRVRN